MIRFNSFLRALACALVLNVAAHAGNASLSLNLDFNIDGDLSSGGTWTVVGKADDRGFAGIVMRFPAGSINFNAATGFLLSPAFEVKQTAVFSGSQLEIVHSDNPANLTLDVGKIGGSFPSSYVDHPDLVPLGANPDLGSFTGGAAIVTGTFDPGDVPSWILAEANLYSSSLGQPVAAANVFRTVRHIVPEPASLTLLAGSLGGLLVVRRRKSKSPSLAGRG